MRHYKCHGTGRSSSCTEIVRAENYMIFHDGNEIAKEY